MSATTETDTFLLIELAALIAWMLVVRVGDLVKDGAKRRRLRRSAILDKIINKNRMTSMRSRPLSRPCHMSSMQFSQRLAYGRALRKMAQHRAGEGFPMSFSP